MSCVLEWVDKLLILCCSRKACERQRERELLLPAMDDSDFINHPPYLLYVIPLYLTNIWLQGVQLLMFPFWLLVVFPVLACMNCCCKSSLKKVYKLIDKTIATTFKFLNWRRVKDDERMKVPRFIVFGYLAPPAFTFYLFFLCVMTGCYVLAAFWSGFLIDTTDICNPYDDYNCFTAKGKLVSKPIERPINFSELTCFNQTSVSCFKFVYNVQEGITLAATVLIVSWVIILVLTWLLLKCSGGQGSGCYLPCRCCRKGRCWCSCGCRCIITLIFQLVLFFVPFFTVLLPFSNTSFALLFKNYFSLDTTGDFLSSDSIKLLHISTIIIYGVFVPWCCFKREPSVDADIEGEEEIARNEVHRLEAGLSNGELQGPTHVCISGTGDASESVRMEALPF